jgi:uridine kinase
VLQLTWCTWLQPEGLKTDTELIAPLLERVNRNLSNFDRHKPIILGIAGGSGSGKTTLARAICEALGKVRTRMVQLLHTQATRGVYTQEHVTYITHDSYYKDLSDKTMEEREKWNFDHPDSLDTDLLVEHIRTLKRNEVGDRSCR